MFPWQSAFSGHEVDLAVIVNVLEQHISGDIAFAARQLWYATGDKEWLSQDGYALAKGTPLFVVKIKKHNFFSRRSRHC